MVKENDKCWVKIGKWEFERIGNLIENDTVCQTHK